MVLYLKYRPQTLSDLIGQKAVVETLQNSFKNQKLAHAYLFVGPRGTGKTSTARILAKMVNCENSSEGIPCNKCPACLSITDGSNMDIIELDGASNRGIDDIRTLRENIKLSPSSSKKKIYIIDEVHMLTTEAFNALLKTLEEPPAHVMFILATTEAGKIPQTILSRVQKLDFNLASSDDLVLALKKITDSEKIKVEDGALKMIAQSATGSFRDAVKLLDQIAATHPEITSQIVSDSLKTGDFVAILELLSSMAEKNTQTSLGLVIKLTESGNVKELILSLMGVMRDLVFIKNGLSEIAKDNYSEEKYAVLSDLAGKFSMLDLTSGLIHLQEALERLKTASIASLPLEIAVVEICGKGTGDSLQVTDTIVIPVKTGIQLIQNPPIITSIPEQILTPQSLSDSHDDRIGDIPKLQEKWTFVLETIRPFNYSLEALLRSVKIIKADDGLVILEVPYSFHQKILESPKSRDLLESVISGVLSKPIKVSTVLGVRPARLEDIANVETAADDEIINLASEIFNGKLID